jgi:Uma2 family endonuclease
MSRQAGHKPPRGVNLRRGPPVQRQTPIVMLALTSAALDLPLSALRPITVDEYHAMAEAGIFRDGERVELLGGHLLPMAAVAAPHYLVTNRLTDFFGDRRRGRYRMSVQNPVRLDEVSEPEPDLALLRPDYDDAVAIAGPDQVLLVVEVSDTTLRKDRAIKRPYYAASGIPEVWIVDVNACAVEVAYGTEGGAYVALERFAPGDDRPLVPQLLPGLPPLDLEALFRGLDRG